MFLSENFFEILGALRCILWIQGYSETPKPYTKLPISAIQGYSETPKPHSKLPISVKKRMYCAKVEGGCASLSPTP